MIISRNEAILFCKSFPGVVEDYPFGGDHAVMRHMANRKMFALICVRDETVWMNLKAEPEHVVAYQAKYASVVPAYHMNKKHWVSVILDGSIDSEALRKLVAESYALTAPRVRRLE